MKIKVYGKEGCGYCNATQAWLNDNNVAYEYVSLDDDTKRQSFYKEHALGPFEQSVPQIFIDDKRIGGYSQLMSIRPQVLSESEVIFDEKF